jgi:nucleolar protein 15
LIPGPEWDSSDEEDNEPATKSSSLVVKKTTKKQPTSKSSSSKSAKSSKAGTKYDDKKGKKDDDDDNEEKDLVLYVGHLPKDFEEIDLRRFLTQFGKVYNCRVARKIETGKSKGFAFIRFGDDEVTQIACETLHGYFLEKQRLVCQVRPAHPGMFFDTDKMIDKRQKKLTLETKQRNNNLANSDKLKAITSKLVTREMKKRERLEALGIDYDFPGYKSNQTDFEEQFVPKEDIDTAADVNKEDNGSAKKTKRRKDSIGSQGSASSAEKKKKRKNSIDKKEEPVDKKPERLTRSAKKDTKNKKRRTSA